MAKKTRFKIKTKKGITTIKVVAVMDNPEKDSIWTMGTSYSAVVEKKVNKKEITQVSHNVMSQIKKR